MSEEYILRYTDLAAIIQMAKARGWSTMRIVRAMSLGLTYADALKTRAESGAAARYLSFRIHAASEE